MVRVRVETVIAAPVEEVFDVAADPERQLEWDASTLRSVVKLSEGPLAKGSRYRGTFKRMGTVEYEFAEFDRPHRFAHRAALKMGRSQHVFTFEGSAGGTRITQEGTFEPKGPWVVMAPMMARMFRKRFQDISSELDAYLTARGASAAR